MDHVPGEESGERLVVLACSDCGEERPHRMRYRDEAVAEMRCTECGRTIVLSRAVAGEGMETDGKPEKLGTPGTPRIARRLSAAAFGLSLRAASKPFRLWRQVRREGTEAVKSMPIRAATKPLRLARELQDEIRKDSRGLL